MKNLLTERAREAKTEKHNFDGLPSIWQRSPTAARGMRGISSSTGGQPHRQKNKIK